MVHIKGKKLYIIGLSFVALISMLVWGWLTTNKYYVSVCIGITLLIIIISVLVMDKNKFLLNPLTLFSIMYLTAPFSVFYLVSTNFETNNFAGVYTYGTEFPKQFAISILWFLIGYICFVIGYKCLEGKHINDNYIINNKTDVDDISNSMLLITTWLFWGIAIANFAVNIRSTAGNLISYFSNIAVINYKYGNVSTDIGYNFGYLSVYLYIYYLQKNKKKINSTFWLLLISTTIIRSSTGRIFQTIVYLGIVIGMMYIYNIQFEKKIKNGRYVRIAMFLGGFAIIFYILRLMSRMNYNGVISGSFVEAFQDVFAEIGYYLFDRGNTVNVILMPKIISSWEKDCGGFLLGRSILSGLNAYFGFLSDVFPATSMIIKAKWYSDVISGALPASGVGEMYINFFVFGPTLGMFLLGIMGAKIYRWFIKQNQFWKRLIYMEILFSFFFIFPKTDFSTFPFFNVGLIFVTFLGLGFFSKKKRRL